MQPCRKGGRMGDKDSPGVSSNEVAVSKATAVGVTRAWADTASGCPSCRDRGGGMARMGKGWPGQPAQGSRAVV